MKQAWRVYVDGASLGNPGDAGAGIVAYDIEGNELLKESIYVGEMTNNMAEYEALLRALIKARDSGVEDLQVYTDSQLVANQVSGSYKVTKGHLAAYVSQVKATAKCFRSFSLEYVPREQNAVADKLAKNGALRGRRVVAGGATS